METGWEWITRGYSEKIQECKVGLLLWKGSKVGHTFLQKLKRCSLSWQNLRASTLTNARAMTKIKKDLEEVLDIEETMWKQKSRNQWMKQGDGKDIFFESKIKNALKGNGSLGLRILRKW